MRLTACEMLEVGMAERPKFIGYGAMRAARSPSSKMLVEALDPMRGAGLYSQDANGKPTVKINYLTENTTAVPLTSFACTVGTQVAPKQTTFTIDKFLMDGLSFEAKQFSDLCEGVDAYYSSVYNRSSANFGSSTNAALNKFNAMGQMKAQFELRMRSTIINPIENYILTKLAPGYNPLRASAVVQPTKIKDATGHYVEDFLEELNALKMTTGYCGKYIAIGGVKWANWFSKTCDMPNIHCCSELGTNWQVVRDSMPFEFYFSNLVDSIYGQGTIIIIEEGALAMLTFNENQFRPSAEWCCDEFGTLDLQLAECCEDTFNLKLETFSTKKGMCATGGVPSVDVYWMLKYDVWTRPFNFRTDVAPLSGDTGIYHYVMQ